MNIYGWDTVSALSVETANSALAQNSNKLISDFKVSGETLSTPYDLQGEFGPWRIVPGGSGNLLRLAVPIAAGTVRPGAAAGIDLAGCTALVDVSLELLPAPDGHSQDLVFALHQAGQLGDQGRPGVITPVGLQGPGATSAALGAVGTGLVLNGVAESLAANAHAVSFVFASLNPMAPGAGSWLAPVHSAFLYQETVGGAGHLAILSTTTDRDVSGLQHTVDPELLAGGGELAFAMSTDLFLTHLVAPGLPQVFGGGANPGCFGYDPAKHVITAAHGFGTSSVKEGAIWYTPQVTSLSLGVVGGALALSVNGNCDLKAGISMDWWITSQYSMRYAPAGQSISFSPDQGSRSGHTAHIPWWFWAGGPLVESITQIVVTMISDSLAGVLSGRLGSTGLGTMAATSVHWQGVQAFNATSARLDGALMVNGNPA
ncbi:TULIP family P47-like protein [Streptacidiphilus sp. PAMC 29251]